MAPEDGHEPIKRASISAADRLITGSAHSGAFALGAVTAVYMLPDSGFGVLALSNGFPTGAPDALCQSVLDLATTGTASRDWLPAMESCLTAAEDGFSYGTGINWDIAPPDRTAALADEVYLGTYHNDYYGEVEITQGSDGLVMGIGPLPLEFPLRAMTTILSPGNHQGRMRPGEVVSPSSLARTELPFPSLMNTLRRMDRVS